VKVYIETYGCTLNKGDSLSMETLLEDAGIQVTQDEEEADVTILNTCVVRLETEERMKQRIRELSRKTKKLVVAGCMVGSQPATVSLLAPGASLVGPQAINRVVEAVISREKKAFLRPEKPITMPRKIDGKIAIIPIQDGCASSCSFCITKLSRTLLRSYPLRAIKEAVQEAVRRGAVEIELTGQDTATYGLDQRGEVTLVDVVNEVLEVEGDYMIRIGMMNPEHLPRILDGLIEVLKSKRVYKFLHLPVQSGDNGVLKVMNRRYTVEEYSEMIKEIRLRIPSVNITTDIIVGHPGEDEEAFRNTLRLMEELRFERVHLAMYSIRPNTESARMRQVPDEVKKSRMRRANFLYESISSEIHSEYLGSICTVLTTEFGRKGSIVGRTPNYIPVVVDGANDLGKWVNVRINGFTFYDLRGAFISPVS